MMTTDFADTLSHAATEAELRDVNKNLQVERGSGDDVPSLAEAAVDRSDTLDISTIQIQYNKG